MRRGANIAADGTSVGADGCLGNCAGAREIHVGSTVDVAVAVVVVAAATGHVTVSVIPAEHVWSDVLLLKRIDSRICSFPNHANPSEPEVSPSLIRHAVGDAVPHAKSQPQMSAGRH
eukprot:CAMPEP_0198125772 /NCGR_PEP_ID=MMETSP1442-20131203/43357_1 /TAXON_ID= /ORGANISM="Craspedostauros australis, Strain CCMP3328" /LENGTH=116 /DNA_ID=CAMNT_0043785437 /DNA_START=203 /DNA_END=550 /DNA_ORIENTATION=-